MTAKWGVEADAGTFWLVAGSGQERTTAVGQVRVLPWARYPLDTMRQRAWPASLARYRKAGRR